MLSQYIKAGLRNIAKNKSFSLINVIGLSLGLASMMALAMLVHQYYTTDGFHEHRDRMYYLKIFTPERESYSQTTFPLLYEIQKSAPEVEAATHVQGWYAPWLKYDAAEVQDRTVYVDSGFFKIFSFPLAEGNASRALHDKYGMKIMALGLKKESTWPCCRIPVRGGWALPLPTTTPSWHVRAAFCRGKRSISYNLEEALENLGYALSYDGEHARANCLMGRVYLEQFKDYERAEVYFQAALACDPRDADVCQHYSRLLICLRSFVRAEKLLVYARSLPGANLAVLLQLKAQIKEQQHDFAAARELLRQAILESFEEELMQTVEADLKRIDRKEMIVQGVVYHVAG